MEQTKTGRAEINALENDNILSVKFIGFVPFEEFKKALSYEYELIEKHGLTKALIDLRELSTYASGAADLIKEECFPKVKSLGLRKVAFVQPGSVLANMGMKKAHKVDSDELAMEHFAEAQEAKEWLNQ